MCKGISKSSYISKSKIITTVKSFIIKKRILNEKITDVKKWKSKILNSITIIPKLRVWNVCNIKYLIPSLKNSVVVSRLLKLRNCQRPDLTVLVSVGKHGLAQTHNRETLYWIFRPQTIFEIHQWSEPRHGQGLAKIIWICVKDSSLICYLNNFSFFSSSQFKM